jgi:aminocarboxymuconate-semialdehyde decarboxylase
MRIALDVHAHLAPGIPAGASDVEVGSPALFQRGALRGWMDEHGVERSWISIPPPLYRPQLHEAAAREWCVYVNEGLADLADARLQPLFHLPLEHPSVSLELAQRFSGAGAGFSVPAGGLNVACFSVSAPLRSGPCSTCSEASSSCTLDRVATAGWRFIIWRNLLGNPYETTLAIAHLVFSGLRERCLRIRFCFAHGGGTAAMLAGRWQRGFETRRPGVNHSLQAPRDVLRTLFVDSVVHDPAALALAANVFGADSILFGSDWPFPMGLQNPHDQLAGVDPALRAAIFSAQPEKRT